MYNPSLPVEILSATLLCIHPSFLRCPLDVEQPMSQNYSYKWKMTKLWLYHYQLLAFEAVPAYVLSAFSLLFFWCFETCKGGCRRLQPFRPKQKWTRKQFQGVYRRFCCNVWAPAAFHPLHLFWESDNWHVITTFKLEESQAVEFPPYLYKIPGGSSGKWCAQCKAHQSQRVAWKSHSDLILSRWTESNETSWAVQLWPSPTGDYAYQ